MNSIQILKHNATRQFRHNDDNSPDVFSPKDGFVFAYDMGIIDDGLAALEQTIKDHQPILAAARHTAFEIWDSDDHSWNDVKDAMAGLICAIENLDGDKPKTVMKKYRALASMTADLYYEFHAMNDEDAWKKAKSGGDEGYYREEACSGSFDISQVEQVEEFRDE